MSVDLYALKIAAEVLAERSGLEAAYRDFPDDNLYFMMVDLTQSTNYRLKNGPELGYIRGETFFALIKSATRPYPDVRIIKEIGDAVLICCGSFRPLLEIAILLEFAVRQLTFAGDDHSIKFSVRTGIDFGIAKRLTRRAEDYLGSVIDRLSRLMTIKSEVTNVIVGETAYKINEKEIDQYSDIIRPSAPLRLNLPAEKSLIEPTVYRELILPERLAKPYTDYFTSWHKS